jgi:peptidoglycan/LPS O-acetylase OafA/YrhL
MNFHLGFWSWVAPKSTAALIINGAVAYPELTPFAWWGRFGVDIFFVISGFVIAYSANRATPASFASGRALRLFPGAIICASLTFIVAAAIEYAPISDLFASYLRSISLMLFGPWIDGVYWTLGIEIVFYAMVFALLVANWLKHIEWLALALCTLTLLRYGFPTFLSQPDPFFTHGITDRWADLLMLHHGAAFAVGIMIFAGEIKGWSISRALILLISVLTGFMAIYNNAAWMLGELAIDQPASVAALIWLASIGWIFFSIRMQRRIDQVFSPKVISAISRLGLATYPLYLVHDLVGATLLGIMVKFGISRYAALIATEVLLIAACMTIILAAEERLRQAIRLISTRFTEVRLR